MNLNKIFPRLTVSAKLAIAFVALAGIPLMIVGFLGTRSALSELREASRATLDHDMDLALQRTSGTLREVGQHVTYLAMTAAVDVLGDSASSSNEAARHITTTYLTADSSALFRVKIIDAPGRLRLVASVSDEVEAVEEGGPGEMLYQLEAARLPALGLALLPIELRSAEDSLRVVPAIAVVTSVYDGDRYIGAVVAEAYAKELFMSLEAVSPGLTDAATGLVDQDRRFLYHSEHKNDWANMFVGAGRLSLEAEFPETAISRIMSESEGQLSLEDGREVAFRRIEGGAAADNPVVIYRTLPNSVLDARVRRFLVIFGGLGATLVVVVLAVSVVAARQITRPVYDLRRVASLIAIGEDPDPIRVETNDELEDLAHDFNRMASALAEHRSGLETLVADRTRRLTQTEAHLAQVVTDAADAILALAPDGAITLWNRSAEELFGYDAEEVVGRQVSDVLRPTDAEDRAGADFIRDMVEHAGTVVNHRTKRCAKDGTWIPVTITKSVLFDDDGKLAGHSLILRDDRARENLEEQMRRSERLAAISVMAGGIAHEINNPLSVLGNRIELMQRDARSRDGDSQLIGDLEVLRKHAARISSVTTDLLRFARDESGEVSAVDVNGIVGRVSRLLGKVFVSSGLSLRTELDARLPNVLGNDTVIETVLVNLLLNAQQATPSGGEVRVETRRGRSDTSVEIEVSDTGPGIPLEMRRRVFEPFFTTKSDEGGTGLGLAVCRAMVDRLGGDIELTSRNGAGATFVLRLPQNAQDDHE